MHKVIAKPWLSLQCRMIPGVRHAVFAADEGQGGEFATLETWPEGADAPPQLLATLRAAMTGDGVQVLEPQAGSDDSAYTHWIIACPLRRGAAVCGGVAVEVAGVDAAQVPVVTQLMEWGSAWPAFLAEQHDARRDESSDPLLRVTAAALQSDDFRAATAASVTLTASAFDAPRAALGIHDGRGVSVAAISGRAVFDRRSDRVRRIEAGMNEACDQGATIVWPAMPGAPPCVTEAHSRLSARSEDCCVCTVVLRASGKSIGVLTLLRPRRRPFDGADIRRLEALAEVLGPAVETRLRADRGVFSRAGESIARAAAALLGRGRLRLKIAALATAALLAFLGLASGTHHVSAAAVLQGTVEREVVAPVDGFVAEAHVRAGARVRAGETLATLDDRTLKLERQRFESQRDELTNEYHRALGALERGATRVLQAQIAQAEARLALVESELERTRIVAPFDALVVSGDLSQSLGSPVSRGEPLFRLAPLDGYRVVLEIEEGDVPAVHADTAGRLVLAALPGEEFELEVERVNGMAKTLDGRNVLEAEAALTSHSAHLRPGMRGVARLDAGRARLLWIWTHRLLHRLQLWLWAWSPVA